MKPDNVVIRRKPLTAAIIDYERAYLTTETTKGTVVGTPGYFPFASQMKNGSWRWDAWAFAAMILEADMKKGEYKIVMSDRAGQ